MTDPSTPAGVLADYQATFGNSYNLRRLWRDRRAILARPRITTEDRPPLSLSPLRFALTLSVVPMLAIGWATAQLANVLYADGRPLSAVETHTRAIEQPLTAMLDDADEARIRAWSSVKRSELPAHAVAWFDRGKMNLGLPQSNTDPKASSAASISSFVAALEQSSLPMEFRRIVAAKLLHRARARRQVDALSAGFKRSLLEGGAVMQVLAALVTLLSAWMFRRLVRRDPRFPRADRADRLYLYYVTSRLLWLTLASVILYGVASFASAGGDTVLLEQSSLAQQWLTLVVLLYLLCCSAAMARALRHDDALPRGAIFSIAWRLLASQLLSFLALVVLAIGVGIALGIAAASWYASF